MIGMIHLHSHHFPATPAELVDVIPGSDPDTRDPIALIILKVGGKPRAYCLPPKQLADLVVNAARCIAMQELLAEAMKPKVNPENN
jgi:hypothetical protein